MGLSENEGYLSRGFVIRIIYFWVYIGVPLSSETAIYSNHFQIA